VTKGSNHINGCENTVRKIHCKLPAQLSAENLNKVKDMENNLGVMLVAYKSTEFAALSDKQVQDLHKLEKDLHTTIIAYK
jgi:hypothetical protein